MRSRQRELLSYLAHRARMGDSLYIEAFSVYFSLVRTSDNELSMLRDLLTIHKDSKLIAKLKDDNIFC